MKKKFYGWIPILSEKLIIEQKLFQDADISDFEKSFRPEFSEVLLSDRIFDKLFGLKHKVSYEIKNLEGCEECGEKVLYLSIRVSNRKGEKLIESDVWIHGSGLTKYNIKYASAKHPFPERIMHKLVRDVFHIHVHHSSDSPLLPIKAENEDEAKKKILEEYVRKFIEYKRIASKTKLKDAVEDFSRARGEIVYAKSAYKLFHKALVSNSYLASSFKSFDESFKILLERASYRLHLATNYIIICLTTLLIAIAFLELSWYYPQWLITIKTVKLHMFWLLCTFPFFLFLYFIIELIRVKQK